VFLHVISCNICVLQLSQSQMCTIFNPTNCTCHLTFRGPYIVIYSYNKTSIQRDALISQIYFWNRALNVSDRFSVHHQKSSTVHTAIHTGYAYCLLASSQHNLFDIHLLLCIQCWTPDDGQKTCPKRVEFNSKNKFEKLLNLVGFIIRMHMSS